MVLGGVALPHFNSLGSWDFGELLFYLIRFSIHAHGAKAVAELVV